MYGPAVATIPSSPRTSSGGTQASCWSQTHPCGAVATLITLDMHGSKYAPTVDEMRSWIRDYVLAHPDSHRTLLMAEFDKHGYQLIYTLPYECETQPIEMLWAYVKNYVARVMGTDHSVQAVTELARRGFCDLGESFEAQVDAVADEEDGAEEQTIELDTKNILFIVGGAFVGLEDIISKRLNKNKGSIGFGASVSAKNESLSDGKMLSNIEPEDLTKFGLIPELVGRLPVITHLHELNEEQLVRVLTEPKNALVKQFDKMFQLEQVNLEFDDDALIAVAKDAITRKTGARGLRSVIEKRLIKVQYDLPDLKEQGATSVKVTKDVIEGNSEPLVIFEPKVG